MTMQTNFNLSDRNTVSVISQRYLHLFLQLFLMMQVCTFIVPAQAQSDKTLRSLSEWISACHSFSHDAQACLITVTRPEARSGHGGEAYVIPLNSPKSALMTRSGVFLSPAVHQQIARVITDSGNRTEVLTKSGMLCSVYAYLETDYMNGFTQEALDSFARFQTDNRSAKAVFLGKINQKKEVYSFALTTGELVGWYFKDRQRNAGIWAACSKQDTEYGVLSLAAENFFSTILGSARQY